jgi:hypothetical protein
MSDPFISNWPTLDGRQVVKAEAEEVDAVLGLYRVVLHDSAGKRLNVRMPLGVLRLFVETSQRLLKRQK